MTEGYIDVVFRMAGRQMGEDILLEELNIQLEKKKITEQRFNDLRSYVLNH